MPEVLSFGEALKNIIKARKLNIRKFQVLLGLKSATTISRVINNKCSAEGADALLRLVLEKVTDLTEAEKESLSVGLRLSRIGAERLNAYASLRKLLLSDDTRKAAETLPALDLQLEIYAAGECEILVTNCLDVRVIKSLSELLRRNPVARISHYIFAPRLKSLSDAVNVISCIMYDTRYAAYTITSPEYGVAAGDTLIIRNASKCGTLVLFDDQFRCESIAFDAAHDFMKISSRMLDNVEVSRLMHMNRFDMTSMNGYLQFNEYLLKCEKNRAIYQFAPDICIEYLPADVFIHKFMLGLPEMSGEIQQKIFYLKDEYRKRTENILNKRNETVLVMNENALAAFAETGCLADHLDIMEPFTVAERVTILAHLIYMIRELPYFRIYLTTAECANSVICFKGMSTIVYNPHSDYDMYNGYQETMLESPEETGTYIDFFMNDLILNFCHDADYTVSYIQGLIAELNKRV